MIDATHIAAYLHDQGIEAEVVHLSVHTPTVAEAAQAVGATVERIIKSVLFMAEGTPVLVIANGTARVDYKRVADHLNLSRKRVKLADAATVLAVTGFAVGTVPPFGHPTRLRTLIEASVLEQPEVYGGGGAIDALLRIAPAEIVRATQAETVNVVAPSMDQEPPHDESRAA